MNELLRQYKGQNVEPLALPSDGALFLMYSSGTTGKPKGAQPSIAGYLAYVTATSKWVLDIHPEDIYWCMADIGWITGHSDRKSTRLNSSHSQISYAVFCLKKKKKTTKNKQQ